MKISSLLIDYIAGVAGGISVVVVGHPFDTTKTRMQVSPNGFYKGTIDCVKKTIQLEGLKGFYSGIMSPLFGQMFFRAASFATFYSTLDALVGIDRPTTFQFGLSGAFTGFWISFIEAPIDLIKTKLQIQIFSPEKKPPERVYSVVTEMVKRHGVLSLWQGLNATVCRNIPANAMFFPDTKPNSIVNEIVKRALATKHNKEEIDLTLPERLFAGACAGFSYWVGTFPLDAIKARIQALPYEQRQGWLTTASIIYKEGGLQGFARGLAPSAARSVPACATMFATVDWVRESLKVYL